MNSWRAIWPLVSQVVAHRWTKANMMTEIDFRQRNIPIILRISTLFSIHMWLRTAGLWQIWWQTLWQCEFARKLLLQYRSWKKRPFCHFCPGHITSPSLLIFHQKTEIAIATSYMLKSVIRKGIIEEAIKKFWECGRRRGWALLETFVRLLLILFANKTHCSGMGGDIPHWEPLPQFPIS